MSLILLLFSYSFNSFYTLILPCHSSSITLSPPCTPTPDLLLRTPSTSSIVSDEININSSPPGDGSQSSFSSSTSSSSHLLPSIIEVKEEALKLASSSSSSSSSKTRGGGTGKEDEAVNTYSSSTLRSNQSADDTTVDSVSSNSSTFFVPCSGTSIPSWIPSDPVNLCTILWDVHRLFEDSAKLAHAMHKRRKHPIRGHSFVLEAVAVHTCFSRLWPCTYAGGWKCTQHKHTNIQSCSMQTCNTLLVQPLLKAVAVATPAASNSSRVRADRATSVPLTARSLGLPQAVRRRSYRLRAPWRSRLDGRPVRSCEAPPGKRGGFGSGNQAQEDGGAGAGAVP